jgi:uncharacterized protein YcbX
MTSETPVSPVADPAGIPVRLAGLWIHPVKACAGMALQSAQVGPGGLAGDREWAVVNAAGEITWQGAIPRLALVRPELTAHSLVLHAAGCGSLDLPRHAQGSPCRVKAWNEQRRDVDSFDGHDAGAEAARWLSELAGEPLRLVRLGEAALRRPALNPLHLLSLASLDALNARLSACGHPPVTIERFRPNLVIAADERLPEFCEDQLAALHFAGGLTLQAAGPCVRCIVPNVDPRDASVSEQPLAAVTGISAERRPGEPVSFGAYLRAPGHGLLHVGMDGSAELRF